MLLFYMEILLSRTPIKQKQRRHRGVRGEEVEEAERKKSSS